MLKMNQIFTLTTLAAALLSIYGPALAADNAELDELAKPSSVISTGIGGLMGDDRRQLGIVGGLHDTGTYLLFDADLRNRNDQTGTWQNLSISNLGMNSREIFGEYEQQGNQGVSIEYRQSKREVPYLINTGVTGLGTAVQIVPPTIVPGKGSDFQLGTEREKFGLGFFKYLMPNLNFKIKFTNEDKDGNRHARVGGQPEFAAQPIDYNVRTLDTTLDYVGEKLQVSGGYNGSWFTNANDLLSTTRAGTTYYISQPLDNQAHQLFVNAGYTFTPSTRGTFKASFTRATQDELIPTAGFTAANGAGFPPSATAPSHLDGQIDTTLIQLGLTSRPMANLNLVANLRYHKVDDKTPAWFVVDTATDAHSTPLDYETLTGKLEGTYRLPAGYSLIAGVDLSNQNRTVPVGTVVAGVDTERYVPFRADLDETTYRIQLRKSLSETLNGSLSFLHSKRDGSAYSEATHSEPGEGIHPEAIDPINISDRDRNKLRFMVDWAPTDKLGLQFAYEDSDDEYKGHTYGIREGSAKLYSLDASYSVSQTWQITSWISHDTAEAYQRGWRQGSNGATGNAELDKKDYFSDTGDSIGLGLKGTVNSKLKIGADVQWTRNKSEIFQDLTVLTISPITGLPVTTTGTNVYATGTAAAQLPDITSTMTRIKLFADYALKKNADLRFEVIHERWKSDDWTWQFADGTPFVFGTTNDGTMVISYPKQNSTFVGVRYNYKFN